jgi:hypothetical protein
MARRLTAMICGADVRSIDLERQIFSLILAKPADDFGVACDCCRAAAAT